MPRLTAIDPAHATGRTKELLEQVRAAIGVTPNMMRTMANSPDVLGAFLGLWAPLSSGALGSKLQEQHPALEKVPQRRQRSAAPGLAWIKDGI